MRHLPLREAILINNEKTIVMMTLDRSPGGIEQSIITYIKAYDSLGYKTVLHVLPNASIIKKLQAYPFLRLRIVTFNWRHLKLTSLFFGLLKTSLLSLRQNNTLIFVHNARLLPVLSRLRLTQTTLIYIDHSGKTRSTIKQADYLVTLSKTAQQKWLEHYPEFKSRSCCIHHAIELPLESPQPCNKIPHIVVAGRFVEKKGLHSFIEAIGLLRRELTEFRVTLAGDGPEKKALTEQIHALHLSDIITLPGWVSNVTALFQSADIVCLPSLIEPFGFSLAEAMACGRACITTNCDGPLDIVGNSNAAMITPKNNPEALAQALKHLLNNSDERTKLGHRARDQIATEFSMQHLTQQLKKLSDSLGMSKT